MDSIRLISNGNSGDVIWLQKKIASWWRWIIFFKHLMNLPELNVSSQFHGSSVVVVLDGRLNAITVNDLERALDAIVSETTRRIVFDCGKLEFTSSAGLRVFLFAVKRMGGLGGTCAFANLTPAVHEIFDMAGFLDALEIHATLDAALNAKK